MTTISDNELEAISINAMGRASEAGSVAIMKLALGDNVKMALCNLIHKADILFVLFNGILAHKIKKR